MHKIAVCVCTYNRPLALRALLDSLDKQRFVRLVDAQVHIIVVDNSPDASIAGNSDFSVPRLRFFRTVVHEPRRGLSEARNRAFAASREAGASYVAFIDDDELPHPAWLESLYETATATGAASAIGPVVPIFERQPQAGLPLRSYADERRPKQGFVDDGYTCNMICALSAMDANGLRFDHRFNATGGEDTFFFKQLREKGLDIAWAEQAVVFSVIPRHRMTAQWLWRRWYRTGDIEAHLGKHLPWTPVGRFVNFMKGMIRILGGSARIVVAALFKSWRRPDAVVASFYTACRGAGLIANVFGYRYQEYGRRSYR